MIKARAAVPRSLFFGDRFFELAKVLRHAPYSVFLGTLWTIENSYKKNLCKFDHLALNFNPVTFSPQVFLTYWIFFEVPYYVHTAFLQNTDLYIWLIEYLLNCNVHFISNDNFLVTIALPSPVFTGGLFPTVISPRSFLPRYFPFRSFSHKVFSLHVLVLWGTEVRYPRV